MPEPCGAVTAPYMGIPPEIHGPPAFAGGGASVLGRVQLGRHAWLGRYSVIRADGHFVTIGEDFHLGERATVHIVHELYPTVIGNRVTAGPRSIVHACNIGDGCVIEDGAIVLDNSRIGAGAIISAGSVVYPRSELAGGLLYAGSPAKPVAAVTEAELEAHRTRIRNAGALQAGWLNMVRAAGKARLDCFVAPTAFVFGDVRTGPGVGIWYSCQLDAGGHSITIGSGTNVQDNTSIICEQDAVVIAPDVTIGHNTTLVDCQVDSGSLIGIGSVLSRGTVVERDVLVAAGAETQIGQRLTSGQVWAGKPARPIGKMDDRKRTMLAATLPTYRSYADHFRESQHQPLIAEREG